MLYGSERASTQMKAGTLESTRSVVSGHRLSLDACLPVSSTSAYSVTREPSTAGCARGGEGEGVARPEPEMQTVDLIALGLDPLPSF